MDESPRKPLIYIPYALPIWSSSDESITPTINQTLEVDEPYDYSLTTTGATGECEIQSISSSSDESTAPTINQTLAVNEHYAEKPIASNSNPDHDTQLTNILEEASTSVPRKHNNEDGMDRDDTLPKYTEGSSVGDVQGQVIHPDEQGNKENSDPGVCTGLNLTLPDSPQHDTRPITADELARLEAETRPKQLVSQELPTPGTSLSLGLDLRTDEGDMNVKHVERESGDETRVMKRVQVEGRSNSELRTADFEVKIMTATSHSSGPSDVQFDPDAVQQRLSSAVDIAEPSSGSPAS